MENLIECMQMVTFLMALQSWVLVVYFENEIEAEAVVPSCWVKDGWLFWPTAVHPMRAAYNKFPVDDSWNKLRVKKIKVTGDKVVCEGFNFTTTEDSEEESCILNTRENRSRSLVYPDVTKSTRDRSRSPIVQSEIVNFEINNSKSPKLPLHPKNIKNSKSSDYVHKKNWIHQIHLLQLFWPELLNSQLVRLLSFL
ncbi:uncharacterized protein LOC105844061 isoform X1 [Hydra vulgaris]|uniref:uncharacterized protein LOC105844061 isoform X1 n=1 Tax=Hydra vulgaris TaxID=6087 RepID=UPI001F5EC64F|nr:uncharacterized protein LOC105844061 isoform X1 [Hydra vulgaris]